jgi:hypothetical protein
MKIKRFEYAFAALGLALSACAMAADKQPATKPAAATQVPASPPVKQKEENAEKALSQATQNAGVQTCKALADQTHRFLIAGNISSGVVFAAPEKPNARVFSTATEIQNNQIITYASANFSPYGEVGCGVAYDAVTYWKESCADLSTKLNMKSIGLLGNKISMLDGGPTMRMFLMPAGSGCVQIKKEALFQ